VTIVATFDGVTLFPVPDLFWQLWRRALLRIKKFGQTKFGQIKAEGRRSPLNSCSSAPAHTLEPSYNSRVRNKLQQEPIIQLSFNDRR
jgi:hypothetical protein